MKKTLTPGTFAAYYKNEFSKRLAKRAYNLSKEEISLFYWFNSFV